MRNQTLSLPQGKLIFRRKDGLIHVVDQQGEHLLEVFRQGFSISEVCTYVEEETSGECVRKLTKLWQQWKALGLLDVSEAEDQHLPYQLLICPGLEVIQICTNFQPLLAYLAQHYRPVRLVEKQMIMASITILKIETSGSYQIIIGGRKKYQTDDLGEAVLAICFEIGEEATHEEPRLLVAHAAAVTRGQNVWLLPAQSGSGKSTLTATLLKHEYHLINDDVVPVNYDGTVTALNLPLKIKSGAWPIVEPLYPELKEAKVILRTDGLTMKNLAVPEGSLCLAGSRHSVTGIVVPTFDSDESKKPVCEALSANSKLQAFLGAEPYFTHRLTRPYLQKVLDWLEPIPAWSIRYSNSQQAIQLFKNLEC